MNKYLTLLKNVSSKRDVDIACDIFIRQLANIGIETISLEEAQQIGQIVSVFFRYYQNVFPDELKIKLIQNKVVKFFKEHIDEVLSDEMNKILILFPVEIIEELKKQRDVPGLDIISDLKSIDQIAKKFSESARPIIYNAMFVNHKKQSDEEETLELMKEKLSLDNLETINQKVQNIMNLSNDNIFPKTIETLKKMEEDIKKIELEIERIVQEGGPEVRPKHFSDMTIEQWINVLDDEELFDYTADIKYEGSEQSKKMKKGKEDSSVPIYIHKDLDKEKNRRIERGINSIKSSRITQLGINEEPEILIVDNSLIPNVDQSLRIETSSQKSEEVSAPSLPVVELSKDEKSQSHYNPVDLSSELRKKHKDKYSI